MPLSLGFNFPLPLPPVPEGVAPWWFITAMVVAVMIIGIGKAGFGGAIGILAVPLTANVMPAGAALGVMLPILIAGDAFSSLHHIRNVSRPVLSPLLTGAFVGIALGSAGLLALSDLTNLQAVLNIVVGVVCLSLVALQCYRLAGGRVPHVPHGPVAGGVTGFVAGIVSVLAHSAGPVASIYMLEIKLDKARHVGTLVAFFFAVNLAKVPTYLWLGLINRDTLLVSAWFIPLIPIGTYVGYKLHHRIPEKPFTLVIYAAAAIAAARMVWVSLG